MTLESLPEHLQRPHLRPIQPIPVDKDGKQYMALHDPQRLQPNTMVIPAHAVLVLQEFQGEKTLDQITSKIGGNFEQVLNLAKGLDQLGLLWGPTFEQMEIDTLRRIREDGVFQAHASQPIGKDEAEARRNLESYFQQTEDPELESIPRAIVAPHLDYQRGWPNYAAAYYSYQQQPAPDRVVILGTNHFGIGDGVVLSDCGFASPLGRCPVDQQVAEKIIDALGEAVIIDQLDFQAEHSIELHIPWLQYCFGDIPVVAALMPDPLQPMIENNDKRVTTDRFLDVLSDTLQASGGHTIYVASSDLSHVGPQFGEPRPVDDQRKFDVERHDREMMSKFISGDREEFLEAMRWNCNPTRWCSIGNMSALLQLVQPQSVELLDYRQACDEQGLAMVSSAAIALH